MDDEACQRVDGYINGLFGCGDEILEAGQRRADEAGLPQIQVAPSQGKFLSLLARMLRAERVLEIGTLGGYSTTWLARGLAPGGRIVTLEFKPKHAEVARVNLDAAGVGESVEIIVGPAADSMQKMIDAGEPPFDLVFIDADKQGYPEYLELSLALSRPGTVIVGDNVVRRGEVLNPKPDDASSIGAAAFNKQLAAEPRVDAVVLQMVSGKGHDGLAIAVVK